MMAKEFNVAVIGATGLVGRMMMDILAERAFPVKEIYPLASQRSVGDLIEFCGRSIEVIDLGTFDFNSIDIAFFTAGAVVSSHYVPIAISKGCLVIDNTSQFRYEEDVPLVIPEVNPQALTAYRKGRSIIANPNCSTIQMLVALKPIYDAVGIVRINVVTYQSVSGAGRVALDELMEQTRHLLSGLPIEEPKAFLQQMAFNVIPQIDEFQENDYTREEMKIVWETKKILEDNRLQINPTAVRVPVLYGHSEAVHLETREEISVDEVKQLLRKAPGLLVMDGTERSSYPTPASLESNKVCVGRIRKDISHPRGLNLWIVADNIRKGAALNAIQIAERMIGSSRF